MAILVLRAEEIERLLTMPECIEVMREALRALAHGQVHQPLRMIVKPAGAAGLMGLMPAYRAGENAAYGLKAICVFPGNAARALDAHQGAVLLHSAETGELLALMNASAITAIRTAAVSAVATDLLARSDARELAIIGAGVQARTHLTAICCVRPIRQVRVACRNPEHGKRFAAEMSALAGVPVHPCQNVQRAIAGADIIVTATTSSTPVLQREWITAGAHINAVGASVATKREVDTATIAAARLFVDRRESTLNEAGDYLIAAQEGAIGTDHIQAEIGEILTGTKPGRESLEEITLFKSLGLAVEDLACAQYLFEKSKQLKEGTWVEF